MTLAGSRVVIIGGSSGFGAAAADAAARQGAHVVIASRNTERLNAAAERIDGDVEAGKSTSARKRASKPSFVIGVRSII